MDHLQDEMKGVRQRKKQSEPIRCPVCSITVRPNEMEYHISLEIERLQKIHNTGNRSKKIPTNNKETPSCSSTSNSEPTDPKACWSTYQKIKNNRQARLKVKTRKRKADADGIHCPICNETTAEDINVHVEICLRRTEGSNNSVGSDDESIDVENAESYDEYEWAGQTRIRASSMLEGGYSGAGLGTSLINSTNADEDEDLNVDGDDTQIYGHSQYSERDVIVPAATTNKENNENMYLRQLVVGEDLTRPDDQQTAATSVKHEADDDDDEMNGNLGESSDSNKTHEKLDTGESSSTTPNPCDSKNNQQQIIESLKEKIREFEGQKNNKCKCLICMDAYVDPVVSICCWHVHCEECWLRTLGARKLCPQCNMITSPSDLRRIYM